MGIDARIFVRIKGRDHWLVPDMEIPTAVQMTRTLGAHHFIITKGWMHYAPKWRRHALSIMTPLSRKEAAEEYQQPEYAGKVVYFQDGDPIIAEPDEQFICAHLTSRYYGPGYARGDWPTIRMVAEWLMHRFPYGEVWYGGDSSGICAKRLDSDAITKMNAFFFETGHSTYRDAYRASGPAPTCRTCEVEMKDCGGGQGRIFWYCDGCNAKAITFGDDISHPKILKGYEDYFSAATQGEKS